MKAFLKWKEAVVINCLLNYNIHNGNEFLFLCKKIRTDC